MRLALLALLLIAATQPAVAQTAPSPYMDDPRVQTLIYDPSRPARLVAFPDANLTVMLLPGDTIELVTTSDRDAFHIEITGTNDSLNIQALRPNASTTLAVKTRERRYEFDVSTRGGLAAYLVRLVSSRPPLPLMSTPPDSTSPSVSKSIHLYKVSGELALFPTELSDDGERTYIQWSKYQSFPAVFGIGANGQEEVVDGYMRDGKFTIDRVYTQLVFRIDKMRAKAKRRSGEK